MKGGAVSVTIAGLLAVAASAAPPSVFMTNPGRDAVVNIGDNVYLRARANDFDPGGQVTQVDYYTNGVLLGSATASPFAVWWTNALGTNVEVTAVAIDNSLDRNTSAVVRVTAEPPRFRNLYWSGGIASEPVWNTRDFQWSGDALGRISTFRDGDAVSIYSWDKMFIGIDGVPIPVAPGAMTNQIAMLLHGGDIVSGSLTVSGFATLSNYAGSLNFPGGTVVRSSGSVLTYNIARAPQGANVHLGTGPITLIDSRFQFDLVTNQFATLENDFYVEALNNQTWLQPAPYYASNATARFTGALNVNGLLNVNLQNGTRYFTREGERDEDYHEWAGPIILSHTRPVPTGLYVKGQGRSKGLLLSGDIKDGPAPATNRLILQAQGMPVIRLSGSNTYTRGTLIDLPVGSPATWVEVAPESSLGFGNVEVRSLLRLMGNKNIHSDATVHLAQGRVIIDTGVKVRVSRVVLAGRPYTAGVFSSTNSFGRIISNGTIRVPAVNLQPGVAIMNPVSGAAYGAADPLEIHAGATDEDSYIERVEFYLDGTLAGTRTNPPFNLSISNASIGPHTLHAVVYDDDGGTGSSPTVNITIAPNIDAIRHVETNVVVLEFRTPPGQSLELQASDSLSAPTWATIGSFAGAAEITSHTVTNSIPTGATTRYYRLRSP